jgi:hypothetical protein
MENKTDRQPAIHRRWIKEGKMTEEESERIIKENEHEAEQGERTKEQALEDAQRTDK